MPNSASVSWGARKETTNIHINVCCTQNNHIYSQNFICVEKLNVVQYPYRLLTSVTVELTL
jgi:hypothetical protein